MSIHCLFKKNPAKYTLILFRVVSSASGVVRLEQKNETFFEMGIFDDGPFEAGDEKDKNPDLVPVPPNSYLGKSQLAHLIWSFLTVHHHFSCSPVTKKCLHVPHCF